MKFSPRICWSCFEEEQRLIWPGIPGKSEVGRRDVGTRPTSADSPSSGPSNHEATWMSSRPLLEIGSWYYGSEFFKEIIIETERNYANVCIFGSIQKFEKTIIIV